MDPAPPSRCAEVERLLAATDESDVDLVLLTDDPAVYLAGDDWAVEIGVGRPSSAVASPIDGGTRRVVSDGMRVLHDPHGLLARLQTACAPPTSG